MAKKQATGPTREEVAARAAATLVDDLGYMDVHQELVEGESCAVARLDGRAAVLVYTASAVTGITAADQELGMQLGAVVEGGPADYVWVTPTGSKDDGFFFSWKPEQECEVSGLPRCEDAKRDVRSTATGR